MNAPSTTRTFQAKEAVREKVPLLVGLSGPSGGGKTYSALELATGIQRVTGGDIYGIDTEARRMLHYADRFKFKHIAFGAPFSPLDYLAAIKHAVGKGAGVIIVDSMSHEHEGPGGVLEWHQEELERLSKGDEGRRDSVNFLAWQAPKAARRRMINEILQLPANFIFCFRAKEKLKLVKIKNKQTPTPQGFMPIAGEEFVYEMTLNCLLKPRANGVPTWDSDEIGERQMMKLPVQFQGLFADGRALSADLGEQLATWAAGGRITVPQARTPGSQRDSEAGPEAAPEVDASALQEAARKVAAGGKVALQAHWKTLNQAERRAVNAIMGELQSAAIAADEASAAATADDLPDDPFAEGEATPSTAPGAADSALTPSKDWTEAQCHEHGARQFRRGMTEKAAVPAKVDEQRAAWILAGYAAAKAEKETA